MPPTIRIIPRLDIKGPNLIKGIQLEGNRVLGSAWHFAESYYEDGADELFFQDAVASLYQRSSLFDIVRRTASNIFIPLTVGGGIRSVDDIREMLRAGADKVAINTAAVEYPDLLSQGAKIFGSQCIVSSIDVFFHQGKYQVWTDYGRQVSNRDAFEWAKEVVDRGAGEIFLTSINQDGRGKGYDLKLIEKVARSASVPVIACGGAGNKEDFRKVLDAGADAVSAASVFHYRTMKPIDAPTMTFHEKRLRMGDMVDSGNIEFLVSGYGKDRAVMVTPCSVGEVKRHLRENQYPTRIEKD
jgi:imidazole glycerol-phosphate synthase subunit HisF